ncbi:MAG: GntR family transcriptional regulator [Chryseolinea sp.]
MEFREVQPIYLQIVDFVCERILKGAWGQEDRIPSVRELAIQLEVNPNTVMRTYEFLQQKEIVLNQRGVGIFVGRDGIKNAAAYKRAEFLQKDVPAFFRNMTLLNIEVGELETMLKKYKKTKTKSNEYI